MSYTAKEVADLLVKEGFEGITSRTVNYYAFDKKMFDISQNGKKCFTEREVQKIKSIKRLQETTSFSLDQIKEIINNYTYDEVVDRCSPVTYKSVEQFYSAPTYDALDNSSESRQLSAYKNKSIAPQMQMCSLQQEAQSVNELGMNNSKRVLRINDDITLMVSSNVKTETLARIVKSLQELSTDI